MLKNLLTHPDCVVGTIVPLFAKRGSEGEFVEYCLTFIPVDDSRESNVLFFLQSTKVNIVEENRWCAP